MDEMNSLGLWMKRIGQGYNENEILDDVGIVRLKKIVNKGPP